MNWTEEELAETLKQNPELSVMLTSQPVVRGMEIMQSNSSVPTASKSDGITQSPSISRPKSRTTRSKYGNQITEYNGIKYHSQREAEVAHELDLQVQAGDITFWMRQVPFPLSPKGQLVYRADFVTFYCVGMRHLERDNSMLTWRIQVIEVKGYQKEKVWKLKEKLFKEKFPFLTLTVIK